MPLHSSRVQRTIIPPVWDEGGASISVAPEIGRPAMRDGIDIASKSLARASACPVRWTRVCSMEICGVDTSGRRGCAPARNFCRCLPTPPWRGINPALMHLRSKESNDIKGLFQTGITETCAISMTSPEVHQRRTMSNASG